MPKEFSEDTIFLLQECSAGSKMAIDSMDHIRSRVEDKQLIEIMDKYHDSHTKLERECQAMLREAGAEDKEPNMFAQAFATMQSRIKMFLENNDKSEAASLLTDGCSMGIKSLSEYINKYKNANNESQDIARRLRDTEEHMMEDLQPML